jgi:hypothetical protein
MGLFNLFGGKKKEEAGKATRAADKSPQPGKRAEAQPAKAAAPAAAGKAAAPVVAMTTESGVAQVKLRLKLAASLRDGEHAAAYKAAKDLADIQAKAGRRVGARVWKAEADRILARDPKAA